MKLKNFDDYLKKRFAPEELAEIKQQSALEYEALKSMQEDIAKIVAEYMAENNIGFNEIVRRLDVSPTQVSKIQKGEANLTLASLAHLAGLFNKRPHIVFGDQVDKL